MVEDDRAYWERHYGITRGPVNKKAWRRLGGAWLLAVVALMVVVVLWAVITALV